MAFDTRTLPAYLADDATFRTWAQGIHAQIVATGALTQTADTGQVNLTTATRPLANAFAGYEIFAFNDALQATAPLYLKVEYGVGATQDRPSLRVSAGSSTNGAGTFATLLSGV